MDHPLDDLDPYALGLLDEARASALEAHVRTCDACASRLALSEATVAAMVELEFAEAPLPQTVRARIERLEAMAETIPRTPSTISRALATTLALAATFALAAGGLGALDVRLAADLRSDGALLHEMVASHFVHAQFRSEAGRPLDVKVVYERHGRWYEIIASDIDRADRIAVVSTRGSEARERPERFVRRGDSYALALPGLGLIDGLELRDALGRVVGRVRTPASDGR